jgi:hypothetical protein
MEIVEQTNQNCLQLYLPNEIINTILEYQGYHIWRNGKFMRRLNINDQKYNNLKNINIIKKIKDDSYMVTITKIKNNYLYKYTIEQTISRSMIFWDMYKYGYISIIPPNIKRRKEPYVDDTTYIFSKECKDISQKLPLLRIYSSYKI